MLKSIHGDYLWRLINSRCIHVPLDLWLLNPHDDRHKLFTSRTFQTHFVLTFSRTSRSVENVKLFGESGLILFVMCTRFEGASSVVTLEQTRIKCKTSRVLLTSWTFIIQTIKLIKWFMFLYQQLKEGNFFINWICLKDEQLYTPKRLLLLWLS